MRVGIDARKIADFGIGTYIRGLLRGLVSLHSGDEYVAFAPTDAPIPDGVEHVVIDAPHYSVRELLIVGRAADRARLDVFHAPHYVVPFTRVPLVVTIHDLIHLHQPMRNPLAPMYARMMIRYAIKHARRVLTVTNAVKVQLEQELGAQDVTVTPNGVDQFPGTPRNAEEPFFLYVGNDKPHKNVDALVAAFASVPDARLILAGGSFERFRGRERIDVRGFVSDDELSSLYRSALALVMPSHEEGFGLPALEATAHGTAVITSRDAALMEVTGDAALHVDARDTTMLADAMLRVARDGELRAQLGAKGIARARLFTWKRCAEITREAYLAALS
ncbi:MAG: glycosyltransferase family 4 protein [Thermoanaerobaculia bacterium]